MVVERLAYAVCCPTCLCTAHEGEKCLCGLAWPPERYDLPHYAQKIPLEDLEKRRAARARKLTQQIVDQKKIPRPRIHPRTMDEYNNMTHWHRNRRLRRRHCLPGAPTRYKR